MEVKGVSESSISNVKLSGSEKKRLKKRRKQHQAIENGNAESEEKETSLGTDSKTNFCLDSRSQEGTNSLREGVHIGTEQSSRSRKKRKAKENSLIDEKQSYSLKEPSGLKEDAKSLMKDTLREQDSNVEAPENIGSESGLKESRLNEQTAHSERKRKRKRERKMAKAGQSEKLNAESVLELRDGKANSLNDEKKQSDSRLEFEMSVSLQSGLKKEENPDVGILGNFSLEYGLEGAQLDEQTVQSKRRRKKKRVKLKKIMLSDLEDKDMSSKGNGKDSNEAENHNMHHEPQIVNGKDFRKEDHLMSILEIAESKYMKKFSLKPDKQSDSARTASTGMVETQNLHVEGELVMPEIENFENLTKGKKIRRRKRKKSSNLLGGSLEHVETSVEHLETEHSTGFSENGSDGVQVMEEAIGNIAVTESTVKGRKRKKRKEGKKLESSEKYPDQKDVEIGTKTEEHLETEHSTGFPENGSDGVQVMEEAIGNIAVTESAVEGRKRKKRKKGKKLESSDKYPDQKDVEIGTKREEHLPSLSNLAVAKDGVALMANVKENNLPPTLYSSLERICNPKKKLLVLDLNGILVDVVPKPGKLKPDITLAQKGVFRRPFCYEFLDFCFRTFNVGIWSSRINKNVNRLVSFLMKKWRRSLLFCWDRKQCTITKFKTIEDKQKPLVLKELRKLWEKHLRNLPWEKGEYDESNTLLVDDSPYKALRNPANTAVFPYPYQYTDARDYALARGGDIRKYLEGLAAAEHVQKYVEQNPFGQPAITEANPHWDFYSQIIDDKTSQAP